MGADGGITIWKEEKVKQAFPDYLDMIFMMPNCYIHDLDGVKYITAYSGDNAWTSIHNVEDYYYLPDNSDGPSKERVQEFADWLSENSETYWEVWT